jgi:DNA repair protein RadA/Sms
MGFCPQCRSQQQLTEVRIGSKSGRASEVTLVRATSDLAPARDRAVIGIGELDRVLGGGVVPGATMLLGGEPGVGKSTLLLQMANVMAGTAGSVIVATAEESVHQVQLRAKRLGVSSPGVQIAAVADVDDIIACAEGSHPDALIVDSIQAVSSSEVGGSAGGTSQVRESAARLINLAKTSEIPVVLVGHVTKDGSIAGPRTLEHMVDVVLYLEGESDQGLRFLRGIKNRYGSVNEVGVFEMTPEGLLEVPDPSRLLVSDRTQGVEGSVLLPTVEGKRPLVVEIQALVVETESRPPRRAITGLTPARVHQVVGVVERHGRMKLSNHEIYVSVMGGVRVSEPAADLAVAMAIASSFTRSPLGGMAAWGELGLTGDIRAVGRSAIRRAEVERLTDGPILEPGIGATHISQTLSVLG